LDTHILSLQRRNDLVQNDDENDDTFE